MVYVNVNLEKMAASMTKTIKNLEQIVDPLHHPLIKLHRGGSVQPSFVENSTHSLQKLCCYVVL